MKHCLLAVALIILTPVFAQTERDAGVLTQVSHPALSAGPGLFSPASPGPYRVGRTTLSYIDGDRDDRPVVMDVWYPVDAADAAGVAPSTYDLVFAALESPVALATPAVSQNGPFPLLLFSHGNLGIRFQSFFLTEALASHGYIVVAPDHAGNTAFDLAFNTLEPFEVSAVNRPQDISFTIDRMLERNNLAGDEFLGRIDPARIAVLGHSFGGYTTLAMASGIDGVTADVRVKALIPIAPASGILSDVQLISITKPTLILGGSADITTPVDPQSSRPFELLSSPERQRVDLNEAGHQSFSNICIFTDTLVDVGIDPALVAFLLGNAAEGCAPELMPIDVAHRLTQLYVVAFLKTYLDGDARYAPFLTPLFGSGKGLPVTIFVPE
ncbi:MAG: alpha/beta fold hydrolase [Gammaproteobacteria bacterium]|nr:alpha/beta fold hydrolase [Gammaproteobacteria bacterium]